MTKQKTHNSFILYCDQSDLVNKLTDEQAGSLIKKIYGYCGNGRQDPNIKDPILDIVFTSLKITIDRDHTTWLNKATANRENGKKGGRPKKPTG